MVCIGVTRAGNFDMALGNIFGSNLCNTTFVPLLDLFYREAPILASASPIHLLTIILQTILTCIFVVALVYRSRKSFLKLGWGVISMMIVYFIGVWLLFQVERS
jgi:cation:H+ antiporter